MLERKIIAMSWNRKSLRLYSIQPRSLPSTSTVKANKVNKRIRSFTAQSNSPKHNLRKLWCKQQPFNHEIAAFNVEKLDKIQDPQLLIWKPLYRWLWLVTLKSACNPICNLFYVWFTVYIHINQWSTLFYSYINVKYW